MGDAKPDTARSKGSRRSRTGRRRGVRRQWLVLALVAVVVAARALLDPAAPAWARWTLVAAGLLLWGYAMMRTSRSSSVIDQLVARQRATRHLPPSARREVKALVRHHRPVPETLLPAALELTRARVLAARDGGWALLGAAAFCQIFAVNEPNALFVWPSTIALIGAAAVMLGRPRWRRQRRALLEQRRASSTATSPR